MAKATSHSLSDDYTRDDRRSDATRPDPKRVRPAPNPPPPPPHPASSTLYIVQQQ